MPLIKRIRLLGAKVESVIGTAETLLAAQATYNAYDLLIQNETEVENLESPASFDQRPGVVGPNAGRCTFKTDMGWDGSNPPDWATVLLPACGYVQSTDVFNTTSEAPGSNVKTLTLGCWMDGLFKSIAGAMGTFRIVAPAGRTAMIEWDFRGVWQAPTDTAIVAGTPPADLPLRFANSTITYNAVAQCVENFTFDAGNEVILRECPDTTAGFKSALVVSRKPMITINPEAQLEGTEPRFADWQAGTEQAFSCAIDGPTGVVTNGNVAIAAPKAQITKVTEGDRNGTVIDEVELSCNKNSTTADEDVTITFTDKADV